MSARSRPGTVVLAGRLPDPLVAAIEALEYQVTSIPTLDPMSRYRCRALVTSSEVAVTESHLERFDGLQLVVRAAAGYDNVDWKAADRRGIPVVHTPQATTRSAAELALTMTLMMLRRVPDVSARLKGGEWAKWVLGREVLGRRLGIVGLGRVGSTVARLATAIGMRVWAHDPHVPASRFRAVKARRSSLHALLGGCDAVTVHVPLAPSTRGLIDRAAIRTMRRGAVLVQCSRGGVVDETAVREALDEGHLGGVGLDVWAREPTCVDHPLLGRPDVIATPHVGGATEEAKARLVKGVCRALRCLRDGVRPPHRVRLWPWETTEDHR